MAIVSLILTSAGTARLVGTTPRNIIVATSTSFVKVVGTTQGIRIVGTSAGVSRIVGTTNPCRLILTSAGWARLVRTTPIEGPALIHLYPNLVSLSATGLATIGLTPTYYPEDATGFGPNGDTNFLRPGYDQVKLWLVAKKISGVPESGFADPQTPTVRPWTNFYTLSSEGLWLMYVVATPLDVTPDSFNPDVFLRSAFTRQDWFWGILPIIYDASYWQNADKDTLELATSALTGGCSDDVRERVLLRRGLEAALTIGDTDAAVILIERISYLLTQNCDG